MLPKLKRKSPIDIKRRNELKRLQNDKVIILLFLQNRKKNYIKIGKNYIKIGKKII